MFYTYLIQRATKRDRPKKGGIDSILSFDYMGAAEYEYGAMFKSLTRIRENLGEYIYQDIEVDGTMVTVFGKIELMGDMPEFFQKLLSREIRLKESARFTLTPSTGSFPIDCWWSIDADFFFWVKDEEFQKKFEEKIA